MRGGQSKSSKARKSAAAAAAAAVSPQEKEEIREYLQRLRQIVPGCPKDGKISRLELIQHVIDYIVQLQDTLLRHPINRLLTPETEPTEEHCPTLPGTPPTSPLHMPVGPYPNINGNPTTRPRPTAKRPGSNSCRRPLGVLSSLNQHRNV